MLNFSVLPLSMVSKDNKQRLVFSYESSFACHCNVVIYYKSEIIVPETDVALVSGDGRSYVSVPVQQKDIQALAVLFDKSGNKISESEFLWTTPRERTIHVMVSSHTDIGLHNPQYVQRHNSAVFLEKALELCDENEENDENNRYRYSVEGTWFWNNYATIKGSDTAKSTVKNYVDKKRLNVCSGLAGNHFQVFGLEEMCRSTYERKKLSEMWKIDS